MSKRTLAAGTSPFAHLLSSAAALTRGRGSRAEREEDDPNAEEEDDDPDAEEEEEEQPERGKRGKKGKRAKGEEEEDDPNAEEEEDDPDAEQEDDETKAERRGYARAMKRCRAIFSSPAAAGRPDAAAYFAFETDLSAKAAIGAMQVTGNASLQKGRRSLDDRMGSRNDARPGADTGGGSGGNPRGGTKLASAMIAVGERMGQVVTR